MSAVRAQGRFHFVYIVKFIRYGLILCLVPMVQALIRFDLESLYLALRQDAVILVVMALVSVWLWRQAGFSLTQGALTLRLGFLITRQVAIPCTQVAVLEQSRPLWLRMLGATRVTVYAARSAHFKTVQFFLPKHQAAILAETMLPVRSDAIFFEPTGAERIRFTVLSANLATTAALLWVSARETGRVLGEGIEERLNHLALDNLTRIEQIAELFLPAGVAWLFTLVCVFWGVALFWSLLSTANFRVSRSGGVILAKGGHVNHTERRVLASAVTWCDVRATPSARLLRRYPVYLCAGSFDGGDIPILVYKKGQEALLEALMPQFRLCPFSPGPVADRSWGQFLWKGGTAFAFCCALVGVSVWQLPQLTPVLVIPLLLSLGLLLAALEAWFTEGVCRNANGTLSVQYTRTFTRHSLCVFTPDLAFSTFQNPFSENVARCNFVLRLPCRRRIKIRGVKRYQADRLKLAD